VKLNGEESMTIMKVKEESLQDVLQGNIKRMLEGHLKEQLIEPRASATLRSFFERKKSTEEKVEYLTKHLELDPDELQKEGAARYIMASAKQQAPKPGDPEKQLAVKEDKKFQGSLRKIFTRKKTSVASGSFSEAAPNSNSSALDALLKQETSTRTDSSRQRGSSFKTQTSSFGNALFGKIKKELKSQVHEAKA
jgi:hypothetical protein